MKATVFEREKKCKEATNEELIAMAKEEFETILIMMENSGSKKRSVVNRGRTAQNNLKSIMQEVRNRNPSRSRLYREKIKNR